MKKQQDIIPLEWLELNDEPANVVRKPRVVITDEVKEKIIEMLKADMPFRQIAAETGISLGAIAKLKHLLLKKQ